MKEFAVVLRLRFADDSPVTEQDIRDTMLDAGQEVYDGEFTAEVLDVRQLPVIMVDQKGVHLPETDDILLEALKRLSEEDKG